MKKALWLIERSPSALDREILSDYLILELRQLNKSLYEKIYVKDDINTIIELLSGISEDDKFELIAPFENPYRMMIFISFMFINMTPFKNKFFYINEKIISFTEIRKKIMEYIVKF